MGSDYCILIESCLVYLYLYLFLSLYVLVNEYLCLTIWNRASLSGSVNKIGFVNRLLGHYQLRHLIYASKRPLPETYFGDVRHFSSTPFIILLLSVGLCTLSCPLVIHENAPNSLPEFIQTSCPLFSFSYSIETCDISRTCYIGSWCDCCNCRCLDMEQSGGCFGCSGVSYVHALCFYTDHRLK